MSKRKIDVIFSNKIFGEESLQSLIEKAEEVMKHNPELTYNDFFIDRNHDGYGVEWIELAYRIDETDEQYANRLRAEERNRQAAEERDRRQYEMLKKRFEG